MAVTNCRLEPSSVVKLLAAESKLLSKLPSIIPRNRTVMRRLPVRQIEQDFIHIAPAPSFRRIVAFDDGMSGGVEMFGGMFVGRIIAAADMAATSADPQMQPYAAALQALLATERARRDVADAGDVGAALCHAQPLSSEFNRVLFMR